MKLEYDLEQHKALNLELLRMINNPPNRESELVVVNKKLETELGHVRLLNSELIQLINSGNPVEEPHSSDQPRREIPTQTPETLTIMKRHHTSQEKATATTSETTTGIKWAFSKSKRKEEETEFEPA